jgi:hypothetical protein
VAHLDPTQSGIDNAVPWCFDCHAAVGHYNRKHPRGRKYSIPELKARRDQIYEAHTSHLVSPVDCQLVQAGRTLPAVGFVLRNLGDTYPVRVRVVVTLVQGDRSYGVPATDGHYDGRFLWNLNPRFQVNGHFSLPSEVLGNSEPVKARVNLTVVDLYEREHKLLPGGYVHTLEPNADWYFLPCVYVLRVSVLAAAMVRK